jgi:hypothetical protein
MPSEIRAKRRKAAGFPEFNTSSPASGTALAARDNARLKGVRRGERVKRGINPPEAASLARILTTCAVSSAGEIAAKNAPFYRALKST